MASEFPMAMFCEPQVEKYNVFLPVLTEKREILQPIARKPPGSICQPCSDALLAVALWHWVSFIQFPAVSPCELIPVPHASCRLRNTTFFSPFFLASVIFFNPLLVKCLQAVDFTVSISTRHKKGGPPVQMSLPETVSSWSRGR